MRRARYWLIALCALSLLVVGICQPATAQDRKPDAEELFLRFEIRLLFDVGRYAEAIPHAEKLVELCRNKYGETDTNFSDALSALGALYEHNGEHARAEAIYERVLKIRVNAVGEEHQDVAMSLFGLAKLYTAKGDYERAEKFFLRSLEIRKKTLGPEHYHVGRTLAGLAVMYIHKGDYGRAEPLYKHALALTTKALGAEHPSVAGYLHGLAVLYIEKSDYVRAKPLLRRSVEIQEKALGAEHPHLANTLSTLGSLYLAESDYARAEPLLQRAVEIHKKVLGAEHPEVASSLMNLADLYLYKDDYARAEPLMRRGLEIRQKTLGAEHPEVATALNNLAVLYNQQGESARAEPLHQRALGIRQKVLGAENYNVAISLDNLAVLYLAQGDYAHALTHLQQGTEIEEKNIALVLATGSQQQKQRYLNRKAGKAFIVVSTHVRDLPQSDDAARLALTVILQRKGRALDAMSDQIAASRRRATPDDQRLFDRLADTLSRLANLQLSSASNLTPEARRAEVSRLRAEQEVLEDSISRRSAEFRAVAQPASLDAVSRSVPPDAALIELFLYYPYNARAKSGRFINAPRYVAYVLRHGEAMPRWADLGEAAGIDVLSAQLRAALRDPGREDFKQLARSLDERVMRPVRRLLGPTRRIFLSPDSVLNLFPFAALVDENGQYLVENYYISYLTSGRDLLRLQAAGASREMPKVFADPLYDLAAAGPQSTAGAQANLRATLDANNHRSKDFTTLPYRPLPGTAAEAAALKKIFPDTTLLTQGQATEAALKKVNRPRLLHVATHGFFLLDQPQPSTANLTRALGFDFGRDAGQPVIADGENPLLRSGLILAGVRQQASGPGEDGVLTALEAAGLDLWGTKLVVLSACETGLGDVIDGEGVYGLRRALVLAGSETQMMSLWKVSDAGTRDLMIAYYTRLKHREGRTEALRQVQLSMLRGQMLPVAGSGKRETGDMSEEVTTKDYRHPYYWAAFIQSGDWRSMDDK